jgi:recombination protein RecA
MTLEYGPFQKLPAIPSGSLRLDIALGEGGIPSGQFVEISGDESSGKTTLCQHIIAEAQRMDRLCAWIDADQTFNPEYARQCGVRLGRLYVASPIYAEQALDILEALGGSHAGGVIVLDSVEALVPQSEFDLPLGMISTHWAGAEDTREKLLSLALRRLSPGMKKNQSTILFTCRVQNRISESYHQLSTHLDRLALRLNAGLRLRLRGMGLIQQGEHTIGQRVQAKILKSANIAPTHPVEFDIIYNQGINYQGEVFDLGLQLGLIHKQGEGYTFQSLSLGTERRQAIETLERRALIRPIERVIRQMLLGRSFLVET